MVNLLLLRYITPKVTDIDAISRFFEHFAGQLPLELFVFVGSFLEEAISPIPSFVVLIPAGAAAHVQQLDWWYLLVLGLFSASGRILASMLLYLIADKSKDWLFGSGRKLFGVTHKKIDSYGQRLSGTHRDWIVLFLLNAIPVVPTSLLSLACGFIKVDLRRFVTATFLGTAVNAVIYMSIGYGGVQVAQALGGLELAFQITLIAVILIILGWLVRRRYRKRGR